MNKKLVALVGRPNVGKSTLFNRLSISKKALVHDQPGVTRDRKYGEGQVGPLEFNLIDTPGLEESKEGALEYRMMQQTIDACREADLVLLVVDNLDGITAADKFFAGLIRKTNDNAILVVNKCEKALNQDNEFYKIGYGEPVAISAEHGLGLAELYEVMQPHIEKEGDVLEYNDPFEGDNIQIVITGRPNSGKSTFVNALLGQERMLTGPEAGITRESVEVLLHYDDKPIKLIDTAGLRKRANVTESLEKMSTGDAIDSIKYANTVVLMLDATIALEHQDLSIANYVIDNGRTLVIAVNKWDLIEEKEKFKDEFAYKLNKNLSQVKGVPVVYLSALNKNNIKAVLKECCNIYELWNKKLPTHKLNDWLRFALESHQLPLSKKLGRRVRIKYISQVNSRPPTFKLFCNLPQGISDAYKKYLMNSLRENFDMPGVPLRLRFVKSENPYSRRRK